METFITEKCVLCYILHRAYALHVEGIIGPIAGPSTLEHVKCRETVHAMALTAYLC